VCKRSISKCKYGVRGGSLVFVDMRQKIFVIIGGVVSCGLLVPLLRTVNLISILFLYSSRYFCAFFFDSKIAEPLNDPFSSTRLTVSHLPFLLSFLRQTYLFHIYSFDRLLSFLFREKAKEDRKVFYPLQDEPFYHAYS
jgi:hypothetical protein